MTRRQGRQYDSGHSYNTISFTYAFWSSLSQGLYAERIQNDNNEMRHIDVVELRQYYLNWNMLVGCN